MADYVIDSVEQETTDEVPTTLDVEVGGQPSANRPGVVRLELGNPSDREVTVSTGFPFPLGHDDAVESPVPAFLRPTEESLRRHRPDDPEKLLHQEPSDEVPDFREPFHRGTLDRGGSRCWIAEPYGGMDVLVGRGIGPGQTLTFDFGLVVSPDAEACFPPGEYDFETDLEFSRPPDYRTGEPVTWRITVEIA